MFIKVTAVECDEFIIINTDKIVSVEKSEKYEGGSELWMDSYEASFTIKESFDDVWAMLKPHVMH